MTRPERVPKLLEELATNLESAAPLVARGRAAFDDDPAIPLAFEALSNRIGDLCKQLLAADPERFAEETWTLAARNRDLVVHHYQRIVPDRLWTTVSAHFPQLLVLVNAQRDT